MQTKHLLVPLKMVADLLNDLRSKYYAYWQNMWFNWQKKINSVQTDWLWSTGRGRVNYIFLNIIYPFKWGIFFFNAYFFLILTTVELNMIMFTNTWSYSKTEQAERGHLKGTKSTFFLARNCSNSAATFFWFPNGNYHVPFA